VGALDQDLGTALLSTIAASATSSFTASHHSTALAAVDGYTTAFAWSAAIVAVGAIVCGLLMRPGTPQANPSAEPVLV
jgi:hypothetical protein